MGGRSHRRPVNCGGTMTSTAEMNTNCVPIFIAFRKLRFFKSLFRMDGSQQVFIRCQSGSLPAVSIYLTETISPDQTLC